MAKKKIDISSVSFEKIFQKLKTEFSDCEIIEIDGLKINFKTLLGYILENQTQKR